MKGVNDTAEWLTATLSSIGDGVVAVDAEGRILNMNPAAERLSGWTKQEAQGKAVQEVLRFVGEFGDDSAENPVRRAIARGEVADLPKHAVIFGQQSDSRPIADTAAPVCDADGNVGGIVFVIHDKAAVRLHGESLADGEVRLRLLFEHMMEGCALCKMIYEAGRPVDLIYLDVNQAFEKLTHLKDVVGRRITEVIPSIGTTNPELLEAYGRVAKSGKPERLETHVEQLGIWLSISVYSPWPEHFVAVFENITERKTAERALRRSEARYRRLFDDAGEGIVLTDPQTGTIVDCNRAFSRLVGYRKAELIGRGREIVFSSAEERPAPLRFGAKRGQITQTQVRTKAETTKDVEVEESLLEVDGGIIVQSFVRDVTDAKRVEQDVRSMNAELERRVHERTLALAAANEELQSFAYSVSHDLRGPLRGIDGLTAILVEDHGDAIGDDGIATCKRIVENARKMGQLIDDLLAYSRLGRAEVRRSDIDMQAMAESVFAELARGEDKDRIHCVIGPLPMAFGDPTLIRQVWVNLIANALKFSSKREQAVIGIGGSDGPGEMVYFVRDNGAGFDMAYGDKLFGVFQRLHAAGEFEGTGVGLAIVQRVVRRHGGRAWAAGEVDRGATFYFALPSKP
jgi:PAS domain S-box-containing protein